MEETTKGALKSRVAELSHSLDRATASNKSLKRRASDAEHHRDRHKAAAETAAAQIRRMRDDMIEAHRLVGCGEFKAALTLLDVSIDANPELPSGGVAADEDTA